MKKIPTLFVRDFAGDPRLVTREVNPACQWVIDGEGMPTRKFDGTCAMVRAGKLYKRREIKPGQEIPADFELVGTDDETGKSVGWVPVGDGPEDRWFREAAKPEQDGTYELVGPKVQGDPEMSFIHQFVPHGIWALWDCPSTFDDLRDWLAMQDIEGVVWHHTDGRMAKIKKRDFGLPRKPPDG